ncbi:MAG: FAD-dependent oxidoreductase, partial [Dactylosporangium sp.]|nr:FAD-dependent oxidoreductase [Dactylosporangium sp.]NNJ60681.1 FAD-dependent oxidoreductase [Dactylosporangium sp.]
MIQLQIDGHPIEALPGQSVLTAATGAGIYIPHLCSHPDLSPYGRCKLCVVDVDGHDRPVPACETTAADGMVVRTATEQVTRIRTAALELILASHPRDCTSCRAYLNCELQALMQYLGVANARLRELDPPDRTARTDGLIDRDMVRCVQCGRCVRACDELRGVGVLVLNHRDGRTSVGTPDDRPLAETGCRFCGACVEVCPTGAILDVPGLFDPAGPRSSALVACRHACPAHTDIPLYLALAGQGRYGEATAVIRERLTFPLSLGHVCGHVCESACKRGKLDQPLAIRAVKRFAVEHDTGQPWRRRSRSAPATGRRVAVVGAGPAGLTGAYYLARKGHEVTVLERLPKPGGMLTYGIPKYRLPQEVVDAEVRMLVEDAPFAIETGTDVTDLAGLRERGFDAVLVAVGAQAGRRPAAYAGPWANAHDAVDLCRRWNLGQVPDLGEVVTVVGGGSVALDCARSAARLGARVVRVLCLEPPDAMLADPDELREAGAEGIEIINSVSVVQLRADADRVVSLAVAGVRDFALTDRGLRVDLDEGSRSDLATDAVVFATGQRPDLAPGCGVELGRGGLVRTGGDGDVVTGTAGVFAGGDAVTGTRSVVEAVAAGRRAASAIDRYLGGNGDIKDVFFDREPRDPR